LNVSVRKAENGFAAFKEDMRGDGDVDEEAGSERGGGYGSIAGTC
jgi:hypothetical protein